jgi:hypothetical protein
MDFLVGAINKILGFMRDIVLAALNLLQESPFINISKDNEIIGFFRKVNYFLPIREVLTFLPIWLSAILVWYGVRWLLRIAKYID